MFNILSINLVASTVIFWIAARIYILPAIGKVPPVTLLTPILLLHATRHFGLMFLSPGGVYTGMPPQFAYPAALGDALAAALALASLFALRRRWALTPALLWLFTVEGVGDLLAAITLASVYEAHAFMGAAYWIPALWVPALLVTHAVVIVILRRGALEPQAERAAAG